MIEATKAWAAFDRDGKIHASFVGGTWYDGSIPVVILRASDWERVLAVVEAAKEINEWEDHPHLAAALSALDKEGA